MKTNSLGGPENMCWMCGGTNTIVVDHETRYCKECGQHYATYDAQADANKETKKQQIASAAVAIADLIMKDQRISAAELRAMGLKLPETIPDCATIPSHDIKWTAGSVSQDNEVVHIELNANFASNFEWIELKITI